MTNNNHNIIVIKKKIVLVVGTKNITGLLQKLNIEKEPCMMKDHYNILNKNKY